MCDTARSPYAKMNNFIGVCVCVCVCVFRFCMRHGFKSHASKNVFGNYVSSVYLNCVSSKLVASCLFVIETRRRAY